MIETISIIIPFKNEERYIQDCLESILIQNVEGVILEILLIDDHSDDLSPQIVHDFCENQESFHYLLNQGQGIISALNFGLNQSKGQYIHRMDADDIMPPFKLSRLYSALTRKEDVHVSTGRVEYFASDKSLETGYKNYQNWLNKRIENNDHYDHIYKECPVASANWLMKKSDLLSMGGFGSHVPEDYDLVFRWKSNDFKIIGVNEVTHLWRDHPKRTSRTHPDYLDNSYVGLKIEYFIKSDLKKDSLALIGAGNKGKKIARELLSKGIEFEWLTSNPKKIKHNIYGLILKDLNEIQELNISQCIIGFSGPDELQEIRHNLKLKEMNLYFFF